MLKVRIPPATKGQIRAVRAMIGGLLSATKAARKARDKALEKDGPFSDKYTEEKARFDECEDLLKRLHRLLTIRLEQLEQPFRR